MVNHTFVLKCATCGKTISTRDISEEEYKKIVDKKEGKINYDRLNPYQAPMEIISEESRWCDDCDCSGWTDLDDCVSKMSY